MEKHIEEIHSSHELLNENDAGRNTSGSEARETHQQDSESRIDWLLPTTIILGILIGSALAVGHHAWLESLNGRQVNLPGHIKQSWTVTINNGWAYLVKTLLTTSLAVALPQMVRVAITILYYSSAHKLLDMVLHPTIEIFSRATR